jgi:putative membrane protein
MKNRILIAVTVLALAAAGCAKNETNTTDTSSASSTSVSTTDTSATTSTTDTSGAGMTGGTASALSDADKEFIMKAAQGGMAEVAGGQTAATNGASADVKSFGNRMVQDHGKANDELKQLATTKGLALPAETDADHKQKLDAMAKKTGKDFDKAYMEDMVADHEKDVAEFQKASQNAQDPDLKNWASKTLPTLQDHLKMAKDIHAKLK